MMSKIGTVDVVYIAGQLVTHGFRSCAEAEETGWLITHDREARAEIDELASTWGVDRKSSDH